MKGAIKGKQEVNFFRKGQRHDSAAFPVNSTRHVWLLGMAALGATSFAPLLLPSAIPVEVWKDPAAAAARDRIAHGKNGFAVTVKDQGNNAARARLGMPQKFGSCHSSGSGLRDRSP